MTLIRWSPQAVADLEAIWDHIFKDSPNYARLGDPSTREIIMGPYRIVYRVKPGAVQVASLFRASHRLPDLE